MRTPLDEIRFKDEKYTGIYRGVVEDRYDPEKKGRCKIRVFGIHDKEKVESNYEGIPTEKLPWADPVCGIFEGSVSEFGAWSVPLHGSHVFVFFEAGNRQQIRYFATVPGYPIEPADTSEGFNDPDGVYPLTKRLNEPDSHRLARDRTDDTLLDTKDPSLDKSVKTAVNSTWDEPNPYYYKTSEKYPDNNVFATHNGIVIEVDSSEDEPRIHIWHPSNSYIEIDGEGNIVIRNAKNKFEIVDDNKKAHIMGNYDETIDKDRTNLVKQTQTEKIMIDTKEVVGNNKDVRIHGREIKRLTGTFSTNASIIRLNCTTPPPNVPSL